MVAYPGQTSPKRNLVWEILARDEETTPSQLSESTGMPVGSIASILSIMVARGHAVKILGHANTRAKAYRITERGLAHYEEHKGKARIPH